MKLHEDRYAFLTIINLIHEISGIRSDILEKDYYVLLLLQELAEKQFRLPAYFKGGTALYKAQCITKIGPLPNLAAALLLRFFSFGTRYIYLTCSFTIPPTTLKVPPSKSTVPL